MPEAFCEKDSGVYRWTEYQEYAPVPLKAKPHWTHRLDEKQNLFSNILKSRSISKTEQKMIDDSFSYQTQQINRHWMSLRQAMARSNTDTYYRTEKGFLSPLSPAANICGKS